MDSLILLIGCAAIAGAVGLVLLAALALGARRERNARTHRLGRMLALSHPEWN